MKVGDKVCYLTDDRYEVWARIIRIDEQGMRALIEYNDVREWLPLNDLWLSKGDLVEVDGVVTNVRRVFHDGDVSTGAGLHYRGHLTKARS